MGDNGAGGPHCGGDTEEDGELPLVMTETAQRAYAERQRAAAAAKAVATSSANDVQVLDVAGGVSGDEAGTAAKPAVVDAAGNGGSRDVSRSRGRGRVRRFLASLRSLFGKSGRMGAASSEAAAVAGEATETPKRPRKPDAPRRSTSGEDTVGGAEVLPPAAVAERLAAVPVATASADPPSPAAVTPPDVGGERSDPGHLTRHRPERWGASWPPLRAPRTYRATAPPATARAATTAEERHDRRNTCRDRWGREGREYLLPPQRDEHAGQKTLVLDLDETLVHSGFDPMENPDYVLNIEVSGTERALYVRKRPGCDTFLREMAALYEIVVFTASLRKYADVVCDLLNKSAGAELIRYRLFRESCDFDAESFCFVKNLHRLGRKLQNVVIVDNSPTAYLKNVENAIPVSSWFSDDDDHVLEDLIPILREIHRADDVRVAIARSDQVRRSLSGEVAPGDVAPPARDESSMP
ncbi:hypothetical protein CDCA_CDCA12G3398 [Cyanidium caldarium]|uniref:FCP1 homology domain-containing protein n=1 Tax=Cyanidium caldarium TaxID=2771 RepID=A0AAV9IYI4_CYACA|nr:hypothetical protein CDCA_CDCA12G3398 [Cyanidium caldarium]